MPREELRADLTRPTPFPVFDGYEECRADQLRRIGRLVDVLLMSLERPEPDREATRRAEWELHAAIKTSSFYGLILNFAGLNIWVDSRTPDDVVEIQEAINL